MEALIRKIINKPTGDIYPDDLRRSTDNQSSDTRALSGLTNLKTLYLKNNPDPGTSSRFKGLYGYRRFEEKRLRSVFLTAFIKAVEEKYPSQSSRYTTIPLSPRRKNGAT